MRAFPYKHILSGSLLLLFFSCASGPDMYRNIDEAVMRDDFPGSIDAIQRSQERAIPLYPGNNAVSLHLDTGLLEHYAGKYRDSSRNLEEAELLIERAYTKSVSENIASYIANDNTKEYPGEDYEDIYLNVFNALNYYNSGDLEGAMVEIRKITMSSGKLDMLSRKYADSSAAAEEWARSQLEEDGMRPDFEIPAQKTLNFSNSALARYLSFLFYLGDGKPDDARIELEQLYAAYASAPHIYAASVPSSAREAQNVPAGKARLIILGFSGLSPVKLESSTYGIFPFFRNAELRVPVFKLPKFAERRSGVNRIEAVINGKQSFSLELLEDMGAVMEDTFSARLSSIFIKTYIRVLLKYAAADIAATRLQQSRNSSVLQWGGASPFLAKLAIDLSESADTRMSRYFPDKAYTGGINLDPGTYNVTVNYYSGNRIIAVDERKNVQVRPGVLNLMETISLK